MNCENIKEKLSLYIDNLLDPDEADKIREHIESCDSCRAYYNHLLKLSEMVDDFVISDNEEYWESQRDKVMDKIEQVESEKVIDVQSIRKRSRFYKYLAVAASLVLVAFVSIYESQEFSQIKGLFDDSDMETTTEQLLKKDSVEDISVPGSRAEETSVEVGQPIKVTEDIKLAEDLSKPAVIEPASVPKKRIEKSQVITERKEIIKVEAVLDGPEAEPIMDKPVSLESTLELGGADVVSTDDDYNEIFQSVDVSTQSPKIEPLSFEAPKVEAKKDIAESPEEFQKKAAESLKRSGVEGADAALRFESDEGKDYMPEPLLGEDSIITEVNIYKIKLDSLEEKYEEIYSPHYRESSAKGRVGIHPDSLDAIILELAEACFQVGILSLDEKEREDIIEKLRRLSINGNPETIEKIQRYIVLLLSAE